MNGKILLEDPIPLPGPTMTVFGPHVEINGDVIIDGDVMLTGLIRIFRCSPDPASDRTGELEGVLVADSAAIWGNVSADLYCSVIKLHAGCAVEGAAYHEKFVLDKEAYFEGKSRRCANPQAIAPA